LSYARVTDELARQVMRWKVAPDRFLTGDRRWIPRWRFQPIKNLDSAFRLLEAAAPADYSMKPDGSGQFCVRVQIGAVTGEARHRSKPAAITLAIARAVGMEIKGGESDAI
jgi:hypothetical protein